jgi:hypothetical protein
LDSADAEQGNEITDSKFEAYLPSTTYDDSYDDVTEEKLTEMRFAINMEDVNGSTGKNAYRGFDVKFNTTSEYSKPDTL